MRIRKCMAITASMRWKTAPTSLLSVGSSFDHTLTAMSRRARSLAASGLLFIGTALLFLPGVRNGFLNYDDNLYVTGNDAVQRGLSLASVLYAFSSGDASNWHPLTWLSHMVDVELFHMLPAGHHLTSILLHALNAAIAFQVLLALTGKETISIAAASAFALHPLRVESVVWISERKDVLSGLFFLLTLWAHIEGSRRGSVGLGRCSLAFFALGLLAKPMLVTVPPLLIVLDMVVLRRVAPTWVGLQTAAREKVPFFVLAGASSAVTLAVQQDAMSDIAGHPASARLANAAVHVVRYLGKSAAPFHLSPLYPLDRTAAPLVTVVGCVLALAFLTCGAVWAWRSRELEGGGVVLAGWLWFLGMLVPVVGIIQVGRAAIADRYTYLPHLGLFLAVAAALGLLHRWAPLVLVVATLLTVPLTTAQIAVWATTKSLFTHIVRLEPATSFAQDALAGELLAEHKFEEALAASQKAVALSPNTARYGVRLGTVLFIAGRIGEAEVLFRDLVARHPSSAWAHYYLSAIEHRDGRDVLAHENLARARMLAAADGDKVLMAKIASIAGEKP